MLITDLINRLLPFVIYSCVLIVKIIIFFLLLDFAKCHGPVILGFRRVKKGDVVLGTVAFRPL